MRKVLIVDDDPFIRKLIATTLEDVAGFELLQASDGAEDAGADLFLTKPFSPLDLLRLVDQMGS